MWMLNQKQQFILVSFFLLTLVIILNLKIPMKYKISLILLGVVICFYQPKFLIPFVTSIVVVYLSNTQISKLKGNSNNKKKKKDTNKKTIETFADFDISKFNNLFKMPQSLKANLSLNIIPSTTKDIQKIDNNKEKYLVNSFLKDIFKVYFFEFPKDLPLALKLYLKYDTVKQIQDDLLFINISSQTSYTEDPYRENRIEELNQETLKKLGFLIYKSKFINLNNFFLEQINNLGLYSILNQQYDLDNPILTSKPQYEKVKKNIYEIAILMFYLKHREINSKFNFNNMIDLETINMLDIFPKFLENKVNGTDEYYNLLESKINDINIKLFLLNPNFISNKYDSNTLFPPGNIIEEIFFDKNIKQGNKNPLTDTSSAKLLERKLNNYFNFIENYIEKLELLNIEIYKIANRNDRKELESIIMSNYFIMLCINDMTNANFKITELLEMLTKTNEDESVTVLSANNRLLYDRKKQRFKLQIENEITVNEKFRFTSINDVLYDTFYFYLGLFSNQTDYYYKNLIYPEIEDEIAPSPTQSVNPLSDMQQANFEMNLDDYLDKNNLQEKQEEALEQYYKFLDKENYEKIQGLNKLAELRNEEVKLKELSFNNIVDNFGHEVFSIIDELVLVIKKFYTDDGLVELQKQVNNSLTNPSFQENFISPTPSLSPDISPSYTDKLSKFDKYILFLKIILDILLKQNRIIYTGFIFIVIGFLIYFIDIIGPSSNSNNSSSIKNIFDLLKI